jgi:hypothetical protein
MSKSSVPSFPIALMTLTEKRLPVNGVTARSPTGA